MSNKNCSRTLAILVGLAMVCSASAGPASVRAADGTLHGLVGEQALVALAQRPAELHKGDQAVGLLPVTQPMHLVIALKLRNRVLLEQFLARAAKKGVPVAQRSMSGDEFLTRFAPTRVQAQAVVDYLRVAGFHNIKIAPNRQLVSADATADVVRAAFHVGLVQVRSRYGRDAYAHTGSVMIPASLRDTVLSVLGLQTVNMFHVPVRSVASIGTTHPSAVSGFTGHDPTDFAGIYGASGTPTAASVPVGIISEGSMTAVLNDLRTFTTAHSLPAVATQVVGAGSSDTSGDDEWDLDSQDIVGISGGVKKLIFYSAPSLHNNDITADINAAVSANAVKIINVSLNECERDAEADGMIAATDQILMQAVAQGQTFSASSGDNGSEECAGTFPTITVSYPASSPYVVAVGGTRLEADDGTRYPGESVWEDDPTDSGGGGPSEYEPMPSWQVGVGRNASGSTRGVPDVALDASPATGAVITLHGQLAQYGGTSLSAPLFAGAWARVLASQGTGFGFAAPLLYDLPSDAFHDVTQGQNIGESADYGWDYASGFGSLNLNRTIIDFSGPVANFSYTIAGSAINFTDTSVDWGHVLSSHVWDFGDGSTSTAIDPSHTYASNGYYNVSETVTDAASGKTSVKTVSISLQTASPPPTANFIYSDDSGLFPGTYRFQDTSTDPDVFNDEIDWYFGDGGHGVSIGIDSSVMYTYAQGGTYQVTEVVHNYKNGDGSVTKIVVVTPTSAPRIDLPATSGGGYTVNWTSVTSAGRYVLQQQFDGGDWVTVQDSTLASWFSITKLGPHASGHYGYRVQACNDGGCGPFSQIATIMVTLGTPAPPPDTAPALSVPATNSTGSYTVSWSMVTGATNYGLQQLGASDNWVGIGHVFATALVVHGKPSGTYAYRVRGCDVFGCGPWSEVGTVTVDLP